MNNPQPDTPSSDSTLHRWIWKLRQTRFTQLLIGLLLLLFVSPFVGTFSGHLGKTIATLMVVFLLATVLIAAALAVSDDRRHTRVTLALAAACLILTILAQLTDLASLRIAQELLTIGFLIHVVRLIVRTLFRQHHVDHDTIAASLWNSPEISSLFDRKPKAPAFQTLARIQNTIACGFGSNKATEIGKLFRD